MLTLDPPPDPAAAPSEAPADEATRLRSVEMLLARAFTGQGGPKADILSIAAAVARGSSLEELEPDGQGAFVPQATFLKETSDLVLEVEGRMDKLQQQLATYACCQQTDSTLLCRRCCHASTAYRVDDPAKQAALQAHIESQAASLALVRQVLQIARRVGIVDALPDVLEHD